MNVLLAVPLSKDRYNGIPDIGLGYLASIARNAGHNVRLLDCLLERFDVNDFRQYLSDFKPDIVGMKTFSCDLESIRDMIDAIRDIVPDAVSVIGGPHPTCEAPERLFVQFPLLDYAFAGEGEPGFPILIEKIASKNTDLEDVPGMIWRKDGKLIVNQKAMVDDLNELPLPAWDLIKPERYKCGYSFMTYQLPAAPMSMTRGCPFLCTFCGSHLITGRKVRKRNVDNIIEEIKFLQKNYGVRTIDIVDENFMFDPDLVTEFCERLMSEKIGIRWNCPYGVRITSLTEKLVRLMDKSGCFGMSFGIESGSQRILDMVKKRIKVEQIVEKIHMVRKETNMMLQGYFMFGFPTETAEEVEKTISLAKSLPLDIAQFSPLRVTPGTEIFEDLVNSGKISPDVDYKELGHHYFVRSYCDIPDDVMRKLYRKAYFKFYSNPIVAIKLVSKVRSVAQMKTLAVGLWRMVYNSDAKKRKKQTVKPG